MRVPFPWAMVTGCVAGVLRDVLCNDIPLLLRGELYASVSVAAGGLYVAGPRRGICPRPGADGRASAYAFLRSGTAGTCRSSPIRATCSSPCRAVH
ncbi:MAG: TRIC cation channel family protein [Hyphomicrobiales bacterium]|nr:TRIC cation channel family protein [Hyphomicrobiales bacterium]MBV8444231.1 TRIC cation channel family protein [Hyphomicrobiales bacterium]